MPVSLSPGLQKLLREPAYCQVATVMPDGSPQITQVWVDTDGEHILINTASHRQKARNVRRNPKVAVNIVDPASAYRVASIRGRVVDVTTEGADSHIDSLAKKYLGQDTYPWRQPTEERVILKIQPDKVNAVGLD
ncbi:MAG TPA: PPOX class F420-dependent oxidoreductase [Chloroflexota bacterium]|nr:PPOX class F420-dependent oxidoreductase [Chloroflexota bacterium]